MSARVRGIWRRISAGERDSDYNYVYNDRCARRRSAISTLGLAGIPVCRRRTNERLTAVARSKKVRSRARGGKKKKKKAQCQFPHARSLSRVMEANEARRHGALLLPWTRFAAAPGSLAFWRNWHDTLHHHHRCRSPLHLYSFHEVGPPGPIV